jgi:hypothetical protein
MIRWAVDSHLLIGPISSSQSDGYLCPVSHHIQPKPEAEGNARKLQQTAEILISIRPQAAIFFVEIRIRRTQNENDHAKNAALS